MTFSIPKTPRFATLHRAALACALTVGLASVAGPAMAQTSPRIGFVSTERIMRDSALAKAAQAKIEKDFSRRDKEIQDPACVPPPSTSRRRAR